MAREHELAELEMKMRARDGITSILSGENGEALLDLLAKKRKDAVDNFLKVDTTDTKQVSQAQLALRFTEGFVGFLESIVNEGNEAAQIRDMILNEGQ